MDRFVVEADKRVVGIAMRVPGGFRFFCSDPDFRSLDRKLFRRAKGLVSRVVEFARALRVGPTPRAERVARPVFWPPVDKCRSRP